MKLLELLYRVYIQDDFYRVMYRHHDKKSLNSESDGRYWYHHYKAKYWNEMLNLNNERIIELRANIFKKVY